MARRKLEDRSTRKLAKRSNGSYAVTLPVETVRDLGWKKGQRLAVRKSGDKVVMKIGRNKNFMY